MELVNDLPRLADLRSGLRRRMQESSLTNGQQFAMDMEAAFRQMWIKWCGTPH
jgi:predicted O-linked N-acetylglucosamine transferase (SPINDLY family)